MKVGRLFLLVLLLWAFSFSLVWAQGDGTTPIGDPASTLISEPVIDPVLPAEEDSGSSTMAIMLGVGAVISLGFLFSTLFTKKKVKHGHKKDLPAQAGNKIDESKCTNLKSMLDSKFEEIKDLKNKISNKVKTKARKKLTKAVAAGPVVEISSELEHAEQEYNKLKELYEKCVAGLSTWEHGTVFIFHGTGGYPEENWFPWLKHKLEDKGAKVIVPQFPTKYTEPAKIREWFDVLGNHGQDFNENTILIGHSLGGIFILRILEKLEYPIRAAFFVSTPIGEEPILNREDARSFSGFDFNWSKIKANCKHFVVFQSDDDPYVGFKNGADLAKKLSVKLTFVPNAGHFNKKSGYTKFEGLLAKLEEM
jgi:predicted alpha/beta hydrolase family esterase